MNITRSVSIPVCLGLLGSAAAWSYPFGPPAARTMAPLDRPGQACTVCHGGTAVNGAGGSVRVASPNGLFYTPGQEHTFTVTVSDATAAVFGFQMTARADNSPGNTQAGSFTAGADQRVICSDSQPQPAGGCTAGAGIQWIEHTSPSLTGVFTVRWTAPSAAAGNVHIYVAANAGNGDNSSRGDHIYATDYVLTPAGATTGSATAPTIRSVGGAAGGTKSIQSGAWISIFGANFATPGTTTKWDNAIVDNVYPTTLGGVTVSVNGKPAPIQLVTESQINALAPLDSTIGPVNVVVTTASGPSAPASVQMDAQSPGFFAFDDRHIAGIVLDSASSFQYLLPSGAISGLQSRAAKPGDTITLFGSGFGRTTTVLNPFMAQTVAYPLSHTGGDITAPTATLTIGGRPATISFIGVVSPGLCQINAMVPQVDAGEQPVVLKLLSGPSPTQALTIPVQ